MELEGREDLVWGLSALFTFWRGTHPKSASTLGLLNFGILTNFLSFTMLGTRSVLV